MTLDEDGGVRRAGDQGASHEHCLADWTRDGGERAGEAQQAMGKSEAQQQAGAVKADAKSIDWNDSFHGLGAGMASAQPGGKRGAQQPNLTEFNQQQKSARIPRA